jgi:hypothetical protein
VPSLTEPLISSTPFIGLGVATGLLSVNWVIRRRMALQGGAAGPDRVEAPENDAAAANATEEEERA